MMSTWPTLSRLGSARPLAIISSSTVRPYSRAIAVSVSPGWTTYSPGVGAISTAGSAFAASGETTAGGSATCVASATTGNRRRGWRLRRRLRAVPEQEYAQHNNGSDDDIGQYDDAPGPCPHTPTNLLAFSCASRCCDAILAHLRTNTKSGAATVHPAGHLDPRARRSVLLRAQLQ